MPACSHDGCSRPAEARGMCNTHYMQQRRAGLLPVGKRKPASAIDRFWRQVNKTDSCWEWTGAAKSKKGYGQIGLGGRGAKQELVHRFSYLINKGPIPDGLVVMHACDNPKCVNPEHLSLGTASDNIRDAVAKGRWKSVPPLVCGEKQHSSKLTTEDVKYIRDNLDVPSKTLAVKYGVNIASIQKVRGRKTWKHIP